ncbi:MAG: TRAP transporter large permease [Gammaproteobacteria bacterium]
MLLIALVVVLLLLRQNLFVILGCVTAYAYLVFTGETLDGIMLDAWSALNKDILLSIPLFILAGNIMAQGGIASRLIRFMRALTAPVPGGLAIAAILSCALFAAVTGSGTVTLIAVGAVMYPALLEAGYSKKFSLGALCAAGTLGVIIPPSIPLILYGVMTRTNIADLFLAGIGPGLLLTGSMVLFALWACRDVERGRWSANELLGAAADGIWALLMPVIILGGIYSGVFTPTESAAVAVVYALLVEMLIYRELDLSGLADVTVSTSRLLGALFPVLMLAFSLNMFLTYQQVPEQMVTWLSERITNPAVMIVGTNLFLIIVGCLMDIGSAILILAPMLAPLAAEQGMTPLHFGIMMVVNLEIGYLTPPLGLNLIVAMGVFREDFWTVCRAVLPFVILMLACLCLIAFYPPLSLIFVS